MPKSKMTLKSTLASCLVVSLFVFLETAACEKACDALVDLTILIHATAELSSDDYNHQIQFSSELIDRVMPSQNDVRVRFRFYNKQVTEYYGSYGGHEDNSRLKSTMSLPNQPIHESGNDVIQALSVASRLEPETSCRKKRGARSIVLAIADAVDNVLYAPNPMAFQNMMEESGDEALVLAVGKNSTLDKLDMYLNLKGRDRIIKLDNFEQLLSQDVIDEVADELCKVTPEMASYKKRRSTLFRAHYIYKGHTYYLSKAVFHNLTQVNDICSSFGGYLAIINDQNEYDAMRQYFTDNNPRYSIYIDGTDAQTEGVWTLLSGESLPIVDWMENHPIHHMDKHCLAYSWKYQKMFNEWCYSHPYFPYYFLCEVSNTSCCT